MGFTDLTTSDGLTLLDFWSKTRSYIDGYAPSQADVQTFKAVKTAPDVVKYPNAARWYKHIASYQSSFESLPGDSTKDYTHYGPSSADLPIGSAKSGAADDEDIDLFGSDDEEEDAEAARIREQRLQEYRKKKEGKEKPAAKSIVTLDVKPWDDETSMEELQQNVRKIEMEGLVWGASKLMAVGYGIKKLQINLVIEDDKVSLDDLQAKIEEDEDHVQSTDVAAMQKL